MGKTSKRVRISNAPNVTRVKTVEERNREVCELRRQMESLGLGNGNQDVVKFFDILTSFSETGIAWTGKIPLHGHKRIIEVIVATPSHIPSRVTLAYAKI
jgi:hypothetical protein